ncbi:hypothetical protein SEA_NIEBRUSAYLOR_123 [Mycobacterium phage NiebruSaylor]|uniref:Uncharacterized protein n=1 Tax=Mycobacterium phage Catdawg TaxID=1340819 RepID=S5Y994_9CAUD|nr:hypothetical protein PBI_CATDAWG_124 [Mycobacterium phage Catdawg]AYQ98960.1 hypothetical protein SEA_VORRPS_123 [Mycobacterium phage Vorrps]QOC58551.1 hypothetical protein SEA_SHIDA_122 [Mycobacterium phage Shida]QOC59321.1 hypothetical protein SEA_NIEBRUSAYLOR_123 [Mycobacterium phage NiebruSaylor]QXO13495.1 hypothetical protein SEA_MURAI_123 [Mycobacterium phage Murai]UAW08474.1 hypothetical protein SEA_MORI_123 [Mycobacterium phage Mori]URM87898.1 hypothetical protein SEA_IDERGOLLASPER
MRTKEQKVRALQAALRRAERRNDSLEVVCIRYQLAELTDELNRREGK